MQYAFIFSILVSWVVAIAPLLASDNSVEGDGCVSVSSLAAMQLDEMKIQGIINKKFPLFEVPIFAPLRGNLLYAWNWLEENGYSDKFKFRYQLEELQSALEDYSENRLEHVLKFMQSHSVIEQFTPGSFSVFLDVWAEDPNNALEASCEWIEKNNLVQKKKFDAAITDIYRRLKDYTQAQRLLVFNFLERSGSLVRCRNATQVGKVLDSLDIYFEEEMESVVTWMQVTGVMEKTWHGEEDSILLGALEYYPLPQFNLVSAWLIESEWLQKCQNIKDVTRFFHELRRFSPAHLKLFCPPKNDPNDWRAKGNLNDFLSILSVWRELSPVWSELIGYWLGESKIFLDKFETMQGVLLFISTLKSRHLEQVTLIYALLRDSGVLARVSDVHSVDSVFHVLSDSYESSQMEFMCTWLRESGALEKGDRADQIRKAVIDLRYMSEQAVDNLTSRLKEIGIWDKCVNIEEKVQYMKKLHDDRTGSLISRIPLIKSSGLWDRCEKGNQLLEFLELLEDYPIDHFHSVLSWLKESGIWDMEVNATQIFHFFSLLKDCPDTKRDYLYSLGEKHRHLYAGPSSHYLLRCLGTFEKYPEDLTRRVCTWLEESGALRRCESDEQLDDLLHKVGRSDLERIPSVLIWMNRLKILEKFESIRDVIAFISFFEKTSDEKISAAFSWLQESGAWDRCKSWDMLESILDDLLKDPEDVTEFVSLYMHRVNFWESGNLDNLRDLFGQIFYESLCSFSNVCNLLEEARLLNRELLESYMSKVYFSLNPPIGGCILDGDAELRDFYENFPVYLTCHIYYKPHAAVETQLFQDIENPSRRDLTLQRVAGCLGEEHPFTQRCIQLALGYENQSDPNGFLAVHQEMLLLKSREVEHWPVAEDEGLVLNVDLVREPRLLVSIPVSFRVWEDLFLQLERSIEGDPQKYDCLLGGVSWESLQELRDEPLFRGLLDPERGPEAFSLSSNSQKFREVLANIQRTGDIDAFLQLLINLGTCSAGKLNGITHSYIYMNDGSVLKEQELAPQRLQDEILSYLKEKFRRAREATLTRIVKDITGYPGPHDLYYVRGVVGDEIGLLFADETISIDFNAKCVDSRLREYSKQDFLDKFYQYFTAKNLINLCREMQGRDLMLAFINGCLKEEAMNEDMTQYDPTIVVLDEKSSPKVLTMDGALLLLVKLGFLR